jgi:uncharacterized membrane protein YadS
MADETAKGLSEDWLSVCIGLLVFVLALGLVAGPDLLGWVVRTSVWTDPARALGATSKSYAGIGGWGALAATYLFLLAVMTAGALALKADPVRFALAFTAVFALSYLSWVLGSWANIAATTPAEIKRLGLGWSLRLTNEAGYIVALAAGLVVGNFLPGLARWLQEAVRPEWYIKTAIVILGGYLGVTAAEKLGLASSLMFRGLAAIIEAYLIYWAVVYFVARKWFGFSREWAAPLASGISICGVSAAIATASAIRARPVVPVMVGSLVVVFAVVELLVLPFAAQAFLAHEPMVAAAWMGLAVKTDGAALASGAITEALLSADAAARGVHYQAGWILGTTATVKIFIDIFIGIWTFILAWIWTTRINVRPGERAHPGEIWQRFPKFILGFVATFAVMLAIALACGPELGGRLRSAMGEANTFRGIFFAMTFFTIGVMSDFRRLWQEGIGRLAAVYAVSLFGFVIWVGLLISFLFFAGVKPPLAQ